MQMRAGAARDQLELTDATVAAQIRTFSRSTINLAKFLERGLSAISEAIEHLAEGPPEFQKGLRVLGRGLAKALKMLLTDEQKDSEVCARFEKAWGTTVATVAMESTSIISDLKSFSAQGESAALVRAVSSIINLAGASATGYLPRETSVEMGGLLDGLVEIFEAMELSWDEFTKGNTVQGIEVVYWSLQSVSLRFMPSSPLNDKVHLDVVQSLDKVLGNLSKAVLEHERRVMESAVCWRTEQNRARQRPEKCPEGYTWDKTASCYPTVMPPPLEESLKMKSAEGKISINVAQASPAACDPHGTFPQKHGHFCYTPCSPGFRPNRGQLKCISACDEKFPAESPQMCARSPNFLTRSSAEMVTTVLNSAFTLEENLVKMREGGVQGEFLNSTIKVFIEMGRPFESPACPIKGNLTATPNPSLICDMDCSLGQLPGDCRLQSGPLVVCLASKDEKCASGQVLCKKKA